MFRTVATGHDALRGSRAVAVTLGISRRRLAACAAIVVAVCGSGTGDVSAAELSSSLVRTTETGAWSPSSPDPSGLAYDAGAQRLLITDGEVDEMPIYVGANYYEAALDGTLLRTATTYAFSREPTGVALGGGRLFITDDDQRRIHEITPRTFRFESSDSGRSWSTDQYGAMDAEGIAYDPVGNRLFVADGAGSEIWQISPVDGVFGNGNDEAGHFDTAALGLEDPESIEYSPARGTLFASTTAGNKVLELTTAGALLNSIDIGHLGSVAIAGLTLAPGSADPTRTSLYLVDRAADNNDVPTENDGKIYEVAFAQAPAPPAPAPTVPAAAARPPPPLPLPLPLPLPAPVPEIKSVRRPCVRPSAVQRLRFSPTKYPRIRTRVQAAVARGWPRILVLNRRNADARRDRVLSGIPQRAGFDRNQYPPAIGRGRANGRLKGLVRGAGPIGWKAHVTYVRSRESRSHAASLRAKLDRYCDGTRFRYVFSR